MTLSTASQDDMGP